MNEFTEWKASAICFPTLAAVSIGHIQEVLEKMTSKGDDFNQTVTVEDKKNTGTCFQLSQMLLVTVLALFLFGKILS